MNLNQITIPSKDLTLAIKFYETLGLKLIVKDLPHYARFHCTDGNSTLSIQLVNQLPIGEGIHIYFECKFIDEVVMELINKGVVFDELPNDKTWLWREARLKDPDNNQLILFYAGDNRLNPPWKLK